MVKPGLSKRGWELGRPVLWDWLAGTAFFLVTAGFVFWQNAHVAVLWDLSYLLDTSWRIALGQVPYRDFPLVHPPGTFLIQAALMRVFGRVAWVQISYAAALGGAATVLGWRILLRELQRRVQSARIVAAGLAAPLCFLGVYGIYPHPIYDCDSIFAVLVALFLLQRLAGRVERGQKTLARMALGTGVSAVVPCVFKQNIGLPFLFALVVGVVLMLVWPLAGRRDRAVDARKLRGALLWLLAGVTVALSGYVVLIETAAGWGNFWHWTVIFAGQRRLPGFGPLLANYKQVQLLWMLPSLLLGRRLLQNHRRYWIRALGALLILAPFVGCLAEYFAADSLDDQADALLLLWPLLLLAAAAQAIFGLRNGLSLRALTPFAVLAAIHGTLLSQELWGSTYAIWPLLLILLAGLLTELPTAGDWVVPALGVTIGVMLLLCGAMYAAGHDRLSYLNAIAGEAAHASLPALRGMSTPGPYLPDFEELANFAEREIPRQDGILLLPGEEPFFFATGRVPQFPVQIFDRTTDPYSAEELGRETRRRGICWVIVKTRLQSSEDPLPERQRTMEWIASEFEAERKLAGYTVYRRR